METTVFNAKRFPSNAAPSRYKPIVRPLITRRGDRLKIGCRATAIPATPPERISRGRIKNVTPAAIIRFPMTILIISMI